MRSCAHIQLAVAALLIGAGLAACDTSGTDAQLVVQENHRVLGRLTLSELQRLPQVEITTPQSHGAQTQKGPRVRSVLDAVGAADVIRVRVEGRDPAQILTTAELNAPTILGVTKRNTLKLTGANLVSDHWVRDVTALVVNP